MKRLIHVGVVLACLAAVTGAEAVDIPGVPGGSSPIGGPLGPPQGSPGIVPPGGVQPPSCSSCTVTPPPQGVPGTGSGAQAAPPQAAGPGGGSDPQWYTEAVAAICVTTEGTATGLACTSARADRLDRLLYDAVSSDDEMHKAEAILLSAYRHQGFRLLFDGGATFDDKLQLIQAMMQQEISFFEAMTARVEAMAQADPARAAQLYGAAMADTANVVAMRQSAEDDARRQAEWASEQVRSDPDRGGVDFNCGNACGQAISISIGGWGGL